MNRRYRVALCALLALCALSGTAAARTIYVNAAYTGLMQDGSPGAPFRTISAALLAAVPGESFETGDVVRVLPGRYYGYFRPKNFVTIEGTDAARVVISDPMVTGYADAANVRFSRLTFYDDCHSAFVVNRYGLAKGTWIFDDCVFDEVRRGVEARGNVDVRMTRCVFYGIDYECSVIMENGTGTATLTNCTFFQPRAVALRLAGVASTARIEAVNSIFTGRTTYLNPMAVSAYAYAYPQPIDLGSFVTVRYSDLWQAYLPASVNREALLAANPWFRSAALAWGMRPDFRLQPYSPCIDTGTDAGLPYLGFAPDMGAIEFDGTPGGEPPPPPPPPPPPAPTLPGTLDDLASSYSDLTASDLETPGEQRRNAFLNKFDAVMKQYEEIRNGTLHSQQLRHAYEDLRDKLTGDLMAKCDAHVGGDGANDWIVDAGERAEVYKLLQLAVTLLDREIMALP